MPWPDIDRSNLFDLFDLVTCEREQASASNRYTVAVKKEGTIVGHLPVVFPPLEDQEDYP